MPDFLDILAANERAVQLLTAEVAAETTESDNA